jgi:hypothetical protein
VSEEEPRDPGVLSLSLHKRHRDLEQDNERLASELAELRQRLRALDGGITTGEITKHSREPCKWHLRVIVDETTPVVRCSDCNTRLDAHTVLLQYAKEERRFRWSETSAKEERSKLLAEIQILKRQRSRLRSQVRKAGGTPWESWHKEPT